MGSEIRTAEQLLQAQHVGRCELVRGEFRKLIPPGAQHGRIALDLGAAIANHVRRHALGVAFAAETGFVLSRPLPLVTPQAFTANRPRTARRLRPWSSRTTSNSRRAAKI